MFDKKINFPTDLIQELAIKYLDPKSVLSASKVSKSWNSLFTHPTIWKNKLIQDFGIDTKLLSELTISQDNQFLYKQMYARLYTGVRQNTLPVFIKTIYKEKTSNHLLLLACLDNITAFENVTVEEQYSLAVLSIYTGGFHIPIHFAQNYFLQNRKELLRSLIYYSVKSGNLQLVQYLLNLAGLKPDKWTLDYAAQSGKFQLVQHFLNPANQCGLKPDHATLIRAAESGNLQLVQWLLNPTKSFGLKPNQNTLDCAAKSGNLQLVQHFLNPKNQFELKPNQDTLDFAARSGNLELVQHFLNPKNQFELKPNQDTLDFAARSGNLQLVQYFLNPENQFGLNPTQNTVMRAAESGNLQLLQWLLNPTKSFGLKPNQNTLDCAAKSGDLQLMQYLLNLENQLGLKPDQNTLNCAALLGNLHLVQYLLNPENQFELKPNQDTITNANVSKNFGLSEHLLPSHIAMQNALQELQAGNFDSARESLQKSHTASPSHYKLLSDYFLNNAKLFNLNDEAIQLLEDQENNSSMFGLMYKA